MEPAEPARLFLTWGEAPQARAPGHGTPNKTLSPWRGRCCIPIPKAMRPPYSVTHSVVLGAIRRLRTANFRLILWEP